MTTDWKKIGIEIGTITSDFESGGTEYAKKALDLILGKTWVIETVDIAISNKPGAELAMNCLRHISSETAADYAYTIYKSNANLDKKTLAVWLIKQLAVKKSFDWIEEFLNDKNVMGWGIDVLDQLLWCNVINYNDNKKWIDSLMKLAIENSNGELKSNVDFIKEYLKERD